MRRRPRKRQSSAALDLRCARDRPPSNNASRVTAFRAEPSQNDKFGRIPRLRRRSNYYNMRLSTPTSEPGQEHRAEKQQNQGGTNEKDNHYSRLCVSCAIGVCADKHDDYRTNHNHTTSHNDGNDHDLFVGHGDDL